MIKHSLERIIFKRIFITTSISVFVIGVVLCALVFNSWRTISVERMTNRAETLQNCCDDFYKELDESISECINSHVMQNALYNKQYDMELNRSLIKLKDKTKADKANIICLESGRIYRGGRYNLKDNYAFLSEFSNDGKNLLIGYGKAENEDIYEVRFVKKIYYNGNYAAWIFLCFDIKNYNSLLIDEAMKKCVVGEYFVNADGKISGEEEYTKHFLRADIKFKFVGIDKIVMPIFANDRQDRFVYLLKLDDLFDRFTVFLLCCLFIIVLMAVLVFFLLKSVIKTITVPIDEVRRDVIDYTNEVGEKND